MAVPKVFVSYSHDSQAHKQWVLELATRLRNSGVDAILDQWDLRPGDDLPHFMETNLANADRVLMVCTDRYVEKANSGSGGVGYEKMIVTADLLKTIDSNKVIPLIRQQGTHNVPTFLRSKLFIDFSTEEQAEFSFDELLRTLHDAPLFEKPAIGNSPFKPVKESPPERTGDGITHLMRILVADFESHDLDYMKYGRVMRASGISRLMFDVLVSEAKGLGLITQDNDSDLRLTEKGKHYAVQHKLIN
ncbi:toll/interleukin-1 receptor domain-containing protein [Lysobacter xanthus]